MVLAADARPLASGVLIHSGEHAMYLDRIKVVPA
ncbi:predicted protein [Streptomyces iranensis]|uniref:Uncharacterized protein n=1 Tax=Streptomyces iranensis TaxID=576784 RepID=A0A061A6A6_9ACTN|nr:predicted protein [Streptomyces iranensis]